MRLATRRSLKTVQGDMPALRRRLPSSEIRVPSKPATQGACKAPVGENLDFTTSPHAGFRVVLGRPVSDDNCRLSPFPVMMLKGRPELNSTNGAKVQSLKNLLANPSPEILPLW